MFWPWHIWSEVHVPPVVLLVALVLIKEFLHSATVSCLISDLAHVFVDCPHNLLKGKPAGPPFSLQAMIVAPVPILKVHLNFRWIGSRSHRKAWLLAPKFVVFPSIFYLEPILRNVALLAPLLQLFGWGNMAWSDLAKFRADHWASSLGKFANYMGIYMA